MNNNINNEIVLLDNSVENNWSMCLLNKHIKWFLNIPWKGRNGSSRRVVYFSLCLFSYFTRGVIIHGSVRDIAWRTGLSISTISRAIQSLINDGWIERVSQPNKGSISPLANEYELVKIFVNENVLAGSPEADSECSTNDEFRSEDFAFMDYAYLQMDDVFRWKGVGKTSLEVYYFLQNNPNSTKTQISNCTGRCYGAVGAAIDRMMNKAIDIRTGELFPLLVKRGHSYSVVNQDLNNIADLIGVKGMSRAMRAKFRDQRLAFHRKFDAINAADGIDQAAVYGHVKH